MTHHIKYLLPLLFAFSLLVPVTLQAQEAVEPGAVAPAGPMLRAIQARGQVICGVDQEVFGFGFLNANTGDISGIYVDFCKALAAAVLSESNALDLRLQPLDASPEVIFEDELDVLFSHGLAPTLTLRANFPDVTFSPAALFYDGATLMVSASNQITTLEDLEGETVCLREEIVPTLETAVEGEPQLTTPSQNAIDFAAEMSLRGLNYDETVSTDIAELREAFVDGRCIALLLERSLLEIIRQSTDSPDSYAIWPTLFNRQAISPLYANSDKQWANIVDWTMWSLIYAEQKGITSQNIDTFLRGAAETDEAYISRVGPSIAQFLDTQLGIGSSLGLDNDFVVDIIRQVGNYDEIYQRHLGPSRPLTIERSFNALWTDGGFLHTPDWR